MTPTSILVNCLAYLTIRHLYRRPGVCYNPDIEPKPHTLASARFAAFAYEQQDSVFAEAFAVLRAAIDQRAFPAASVGVTHRGSLVCLKAFGRFTYEPDSPAATAETVFDLASVSKVVATDPARSRPSVVAPSSKISGL